MTLYLFTTTDYKGCRSPDLGRYLKSLEAQDASPGSLVPYILFQNCSPEECKVIKERLPSHYKVSSVPGIVSLSLARNQMLDDLQTAHVLDQNDVIGFPDDDCWLPNGFSNSLSTIFHTLPTLGLIICGVSMQPEPRVFGKADVRLARTADVVRLASSNCMFVRGDIAREVGYFDPDLGLGTPAQGGEDTDFIVRAFLKTSYAGIIDRELIGHRKPDKTSKAKYYLGGLLVLARYARQSRTLMWEFCRKFIVGLHFVLLRRLSAHDYITAFIKGIRAFQASAKRLAISG